jgi:hypothetical protein
VIRTTLERFGIATTVARAALAIAAASLAGAAVACNPPPPDNDDYAARIASGRAAKDRELATSSESPVPASRRDQLLPLPYYPIDLEYNVPAELKLFDKIETVEMTTSTGTQELFRRVGTLVFTLKGEPLTLTAFVSASEPGMDRLFVPFNDLTSGTETYGAGRYLELSRTPTGMYAMDFNLAFNPYCFYNPTWVCPLPPPENRLKVRIEAGEKVVR